MTDIPASAFVAVANQPTLQLLDPNALNPPQQGVQNLLAPPPLTPPPTIGQILDNINKAIAADRAANVPGTTPNGPPDNFAFTDLTTNVSGATAGDVFKGGASVPDIKNQFLDLTPDNLLIRAITPNAFINSGTGNDLLIVSSGRNILDGGSGQNTYVGASGFDTFIQDAETKGGTGFILNAASGDDAVLVLGKTTGFTFSLTDSPAGFAITGTDAAGTRSSELILSGFKQTDIGGKLTVGLVSSTTDGTYLFAHVN